VRAQTERRARALAARHEQVSMGLCLSWRLAGKVVAPARGQCYSHRCHRAEGGQTEVSDAGHGRGDASWAVRVGVVPKRRGVREQCAS